MPRAKKGQRFGGRAKGVKNKSTILREQKQAAAIAEIIDSGKPLAITVLQKAMEFAEGATAAFRPTLQADVARGQAVNPDGSVEEFGKWFDRWLKVASELATYQTARIKPMEAPSAAPTQTGAAKKKFTLRVFEGGKAIGAPANDKDPV